jgi:Sulfatase
MTTGLSLWEVHMKKIKSSWMVALWVSVAALHLNAQQKKPNVLVIFGDDIGYRKVSAYKKGMMHYKTPNTGRLAHEGALFTDYYAHQKPRIGRPWQTIFELLSSAGRTLFSVLV